MTKFSGYSAVAVMLAAATLAGCPKPKDYHTQVLESPNTIDGKQVYFIPSDTEKRAGDEFYSRVETTSISGVPLTALPNNPAGDTVITLTSGTDVEEFELAEPVFYFGQPVTSIFVGANGAVGMGVAGGGNSTIAEHFVAPQVSLIPVDASAAGAVVTVGETEDFVVVTYSGITIGESTDNAFQVEFFKTRGIDGDIALSFPQVSSSAIGISGLSNGQLADADPDAIADFEGKFRSSNFNAASGNTETTQAAS